MLDVSCGVTGCEGVGCVGVWGVGVWGVGVVEGRGMWRFGTRNRGKI